MPRTFWAIFTLRSWYDFADGLVQRFGRTIEADDAATLKRFFVSQHVADLRKIVALSLAAVLLVGACVLLPLEGNIQEVVQKFGWASLHTLQFPHILFRTAAAFLAFFGPVVAAFGVIVAWAYQTASARLGVVDLFACEISTLCRVTTILDTVLRVAETADHDTAPAPAGGDTQPADAQPSSSAEDYFPVFANNVRDLQSLEARVVINITAFYTYMTTCRDLMRNHASPGASVDARRQSARDLIYMLYLGLESARRAIADLVEFEPEKADRTVTILVGELAAYRFLRAQFKDKHDMRHERLNLRESEYRELVPPLCAKVEQKRNDPGVPPKHAAVWQQAALLLPELCKRYDAAIGAQV